MKTEEKGGGPASFRLSQKKTARYVAWFHELDAWTEYWDIYHPESKGHYYFGDGKRERGLLTEFLPRDTMPPIFLAWKKAALRVGPASDFLMEARKRKIASALLEVDAFVGDLFKKHFGDASNKAVKRDYLEATFHFAIDNFPPATERYARIADDDPRKSTAGRNTLDGDIMWFAWALQLGGADAATRTRKDHERRALQLAGVAMGCPANFAWRGHRRTRDEYLPDDKTRKLLLKKGLKWADDFEGATEEINALFRIREWGSDE